MPPPAPPARATPATAVVAPLLLKPLQEAKEKNFAVGGEAAAQKLRMQTVATQTQFRR